MLDKYEGAREISSDDVYTRASGAKFLKVSENTMNKLLLAGRIKAARAGRTWRISRAALDAFLRGDQ